MVRRPGGRRIATPRAPPPTTFRESHAGLERVRPTEPLTPGVRALLDTHVRTPAHLEVLVLLFRTAPRGWRPEELTAEVGSASAADVVRCLAEFTESQLVTSNGSTYTFAPASEGMRSATEALAKEYNERPVTLIRALYERPPSAVLSFADAFRLRRERP